MAPGSKSWKIAALLGLIFLPLILFGLKNFRANKEPLSERQIATRVLAEFLKGKYQPRKALVFSNPFTKINGRAPEVYAFQTAAEKGLREGFGSAVELKLVYPKIKSEALRRPASDFVDPNSSTPVSFLTAENAWLEIFQANPGYDLAISLIGLPLNYPALRKDPAFEKIPLALLLPDWRMAGDSANIRREFEEQRIAAAVVTRPRADTEAAISGDFKKEFERLYLLVTLENIAGAFPQ